MIDIFARSCLCLCSSVRLPIDEVREDWLASKDHGDNLRAIAEHYGLFDDLFKHGYFIPRLPLHVNYPFNDEQVTPVYSGNRLYARDVRSPFRSNDEKKFRSRPMHSHRFDGRVRMLRSFILWCSPISMDIWKRTMPKFCIGLCKWVTRKSLRSSTTAFSFLQRKYSGKSDRERRNLMFLPSSLSRPWQWMASMHLSPLQASEGTDQFLRTLRITARQQVRPIAEQRRNTQICRRTV